MSNITNYSFLFQSMFGGTKIIWETGSTLPGVFLFSQLNSSSIQSQLKAAGIDTSSIKRLFSKWQKTAVLAVCLRMFNLLKT